ncbi:MAG TPA: heme-binding protein, partial [Blastocatellia bacterium]|nr:heme-binding protein [Blastocatellia bacterium]
MTGKPASLSYGRRLMIGACLSLVLAMLCFSGNSLAWLQSGPAPLIQAQGAVYYPSTGRLVLKGENLLSGATVQLSNAHGLMSFESVKVKRGKKIIISGVFESDLLGGIDVKVINPDGGESAVAHIEPALDDSTRLTVSDVQTIIAQAVAQAEASNFPATIAVVDKEGRVLGVFRMRGAPTAITVGIGTRCAGQDDCGLEGVRVRQIGGCAAAISKAVTGAFLSSQGHAFSTRTASFIVQEHFPPGVDFQPGGPLFGVQFSQLLCSDVNPKSPLGLSADPGGIPIYKNGIQVGGIGVEGDGRYTLDPDPRDDDVPVEELVAVAAVRGFESPPEISGTITVNGIAFP